MSCISGLRPPRAEVLSGQGQAAAASATGRFSQPAEVAELILYLVSDHAANITGADFALDGGLIPTL